MPTAGEGASFEHSSIIRIFASPGTIGAATSSFVTAWFCTGFTANHANWWSCSNRGSSRCTSRFGGRWRGPGGWRWLGSSSSGTGGATVVHFADLGHLVSQECLATTGKGASRANGRIVTIAAGPGTIGTAAGSFEASWHGPRVTTFHGGWRFCRGSG